MSTPTPRLHDLYRPLSPIERLAEELKAHVRRNLSVTARKLEAPSTYSDVVEAVPEVLFFEFVAERLPDPEHAASGVDVDFDAYERLRALYEASYGALPDRYRVLEPDALRPISVEEDVAYVVETGRAMRRVLTLYLADALQTVRHAYARGYKILHLAIEAADGVTRIVILGFSDPVEGLGLSPW